MVFSVSSNEHTTKVVLSCNTKTGGTDDCPKFTLRTPITTPNQMISMVCLESVIIDAPSLFSSQLLSDADNVFNVSLGTAPLSAAYDWYNTVPPSIFGVKSSMKDILLTCVGNDMAICPM